MKFRNIKNRYFISCAIIFIYLHSFTFSQINSYDRYWYFGPGNAFDWASGSPVIISPPSSIYNVEGCNTTSSKNGNLLFYGGDDKIYCSNHVLMPNSTGIFCYNPKQGPVSVQVPGSASRYYYVYPEAYGGPLYYSIIDMTFNGGLGAVDQAFKNVPLRATNSEGILAIRKQNACNEFWILTHDWNNNRFFTELISSSGITNFSSQNIGPTCGPGDANMDYSPASGKLALLYGSFNVALFDFNASTGTISNFVTVPLPNIPACLEYYSVAFSSNGTKLYAGGGYGQNYMVQIDLANANTVTAIATGNGGNTLKLGPDGKIYGQILYTPFIGIVNNPNLPGLACNYIPNAINTGNVTNSDVSFPSMVLGADSLVTASVTPITTSICTGNSATLTASGGSNYSWSTGATTTSLLITPTATATYSVYVTNINGCSDTAAATISVSLSPVAGISGDTSICQGENTTLIAAGGNTYSWSTGSTTATINPASAGTYSVVVGIGSCFDTASTAITVNPVPTASAWNNITITAGESISLSAGGGTSYLWNNGAIGAAIAVSPVVTTTYCVTAVDANGCSDTACVTVTVEQLDCGYLYLPNAFSPNGDDENDELKVYYLNALCIKDFSLIIYDRWGEKIVETKAVDKTWDGTHNGKPMNSSVLVYYMHATLRDGQDISRKGNVTLIR